MCLVNATMYSCIGAAVLYPDLDYNNPPVYTDSLNYRLCQDLVKDLVINMQCSRVLLAQPLLPLQL